MLLLVTTGGVRAQDSADELPPDVSSGVVLDEIVVQGEEVSAPKRVSTAPRMPQPAPPVPRDVLEPLEVETRLREEDAQAIPVSTTVFETEDLGPDRIQTLPRAVDAAPNALFSPQGGPITIRGIGSLGPTGGVDRPQSAGVFLDGVYIARPYGIPQNLDDYGRVEIVRGPQATLYGMNTLAGAVNLVSATPAQEATATIQGELGTHDARRIVGTFDAPLASGRVLTHGFVSYLREDGYVTNLYNGDKVLGDDDFATRYTILGEVNDRTTVQLNFDYSSVHDDGDVAYSPVEQALDFQANYNYPQYRDNEIGGISARVDHALDTFNVTSITAFRGFSYDFELDGDFTPAPLYLQGEKQDQRQFSQELRLTSTADGPVSWMLGGNYFYEDYDAEQLFGLEMLSDFPDRNTFNQTSNTWSAFGQLGWQATERLDLTGGLRYTYVEKNSGAETFSPLGFGSFGPPQRVSSDPSFNNFSPEFSARYRFNDQVLGFARVSRGFTAGGMSQFIDPNGDPNIYDPETAWSYEAGAKTKWFGDRLDFNATAFYNDITDMQVVQFVSPTTRVITNAGAATTYGFELEARAKVSETTSVTVGYGYTHAVFDEFLDPILNADYSGQTLPFAPRNSVSAGIDWRKPIGHGTALLAGLNYAYKSSYLFTPESSYRQDDVNLLDLRIGAERGPFTVSLFAKNILDESYLSGFFETGGVAFGSAAPDRTFGVLASATW